MIYDGTKIMFKECNQCNKIKYYTEFHKSSRGFGNTMACCRDCRNKTNMRRNVLIVHKTVNDKEVAMKQCSKCNELIALENYRAGRGAGGRKSICIDCEKKWHKEYRTTQKKVVSKRKKVAYRKKRAVYIEKARMVYLLNPTKIKERSRKYYANNSDKFKENNKIWRKNNPNKVNVYRLNHEAKKRELPNTLTEKEYQSILNYFSNQCSLSGEKENLHKDHFVCLDTGHCGTYIGNIIPLNANLNMSKNSINPFKWIKRYPEYQKRFDKVVRYLAKQNNLTTQEFKDFVYWCYENPRDNNQIKKDKRTSIEIWLNLNKT